MIKVLDRVIDTCGPGRAPGARIWFCDFRPSFVRDGVYAFQHGMRFSGPTTYTTPQSATGLMRHSGLIDVPTHDFGPFAPRGTELAIVCDTDGSPDA